MVSTHSHPKVAAWRRAKTTSRTCRQFQHTATRRWLPHGGTQIRRAHGVSTHSHPKVAAPGRERLLVKVAVSTHSHPKVAALTKVFSRYH